MQVSPYTPLITPAIDLWHSFAKACKDGKGFKDVLLKAQVLDEVIGSISCRSTVMMSSIKSFIGYIPHDSLVITDREFYWPQMKILYWNLHTIFSVLNGSFYTFTTFNLQDSSLSHTASLTLLEEFLIDFPTDDEEFKGYISDTNT